MVVCLLLKYKKQIDLLKSYENVKTLIQNIIKLKKQVFTRHFVKIVKPLTQLKVNNSTERSHLKVLSCFKFITDMKEINKNFERKNPLKKV